MFSDDETVITLFRSLFITETQAQNGLLPRLKRARTLTTDNAHERHPSPALSIASLRLEKYMPDHWLVHARVHCLSLLPRKRSESVAESVGANSKKRVLNRKSVCPGCSKGKPKPKVEVVTKEQPKPVIPKPIPRGCDAGRGYFPVKPKPQKRLGLSKVHSSQIQVASSFFSSKLAAKDEEEEVWDLPSSSPDILLLKSTGSQADGFGSDDEAMFVPVTPTKGRK